MNIYLICAVIVAAQAVTSYLSTRKTFSLLGNSTWRFVVSAAASDGCKEGLRLASVLFGVSYGTWLGVAAVVVGGAFGNWLAHAQAQRSEA